ncbi:D-aspartate oxidase [Anopheles gambiae]|uniref:D-aspartate oxidase n=1 Tax=Anopheles gambiae TaxID=7165 RepID=UPI002AC8C580|nr:D-aspartate oxidase [Anopheles gambiae]
MYDSGDSKASIAQSFIWYFDTTVTVLSTISRIERITVMAAEQLHFVILGAGINGLSCAVRLSHEYPRSTVHIISEHFSPNTTSDVAAGLWGPYCLKGTSEYECRSWAQETHNYFLQLWQDGYADKCGICLVPVIELFHRDTSSPWWRNIVFGFQEMYLSSDDFDLAHQTNYRNSKSVAFMYTTFTCEPSKIMKCYIDTLSNRNVKFYQKRLQSINCLEMLNIQANAIIVNCLGLNSQHVFNDLELFPVRGQVQKVKSSSVFHSFANESCYIIPNTDTVVLGGTKQKIDSLRIDPNDRYYIRANCFAIQPRLKNAAIVMDCVGLRPARSSGVRLEIEIISFDNGQNHAVIHNYGHGGAGISLAWGCAGTVTRLVQQYIGETSITRLKL